MRGFWLYRWRGVCSAGNACNGLIIGVNKTAVHRHLTKQDLLPYSLYACGYLGRSYWQKQHLTALTGQLAALLGAGLPLRESLRLLGEDHPRAGWRCLLNLLAEKIEQGLTLSQAMADFPQVFPPLYCAMVALGELTGRLDSCCRNLADHEERRNRLKKKVLGALRYPAFILLVAAAVLALLLTWVLPEFSRLYAGLNVSLPWPTRCLLLLAQAAQDNGLTALIAVAIACGVLRRLCYHQAKWRRRAQRCLFYLPAAGALMRHHAVYLLFQTLAMTHPAGVPLDSGLALAANSLQPLYREAVVQLQHHIQQGYQLHQAFYRHHLFPAHCYQLIKTGEHSGTLDTVFRQLALLHEQQTYQYADALAQLAEPLMVFIVGGLVCGMVLALYLPLLQIGDLMGQF